MALTESTSVGSGIQLHSPCAFSARFHPTGVLSIEALR